MEPTTPPLIFESPDGGKTVYARQSGSTDRWIWKYDEGTEAMLKYLADEKLWDEGWRVSLWKRLGRIVVLKYVKVKR